MSDEIKTTTPVVLGTPPPQTRKYEYLGKARKNPNMIVLIDGYRFKPWSMTDSEIDKLLAKAPQLSRLWKKK